MRAKRPPPPKTTVAAIVTRETLPGEILLTRRGIPPYQGQWCLPGGHIERYEPARAAAIREVKEETGLDLDARFFGYFDEILPDHGLHAVVIVFVGPGSGTVRPQEVEVADVQWMPLDRARALPLAFAHNEILDEYADWIKSKVEK